MHLSSSRVFGEDSEFRASMGLGVSGVWMEFFCYGHPYIPNYGPM